MMRTRLLGLLAAGLAFLLDQIGKAIVLANAAILAGGVGVLPGFDLIYLRNDGVTFGLFGGAPWWALIAVALCIVAFLSRSLWRTASTLEAVAYGMVVGGAIGNVTDRIRFGAVTDFLDVYVGARHWPAFNLADVAVVCGVALLILHSVLSSRTSRKAKP